MSGKNVWIAFLGAVVRWALAAIFGGLVVRGIITKEMLDRITIEGTEPIVAAILGLIVPLLWSFWQKIVQKVREKNALDVSPTAKDPEQIVSKKTAETPIPEKLSIAFGGDK